MRYLFFAILLPLLAMGCAQSKSKPITEVSQNELNNVILIDVRTPEEYEEGHIDKALNINWYDEDFAQLIKEIDENKTIYLYCKKGGRSAKAQALLDSLGYDVVNLEGGYDSYLKE